MTNESSYHAYGDTKRLETTTQSPVVCLLQATRLPANYARVVKAVVEGPASKEVQLNEPSEELKDTGLSSEEGIVTTVWLHSW